VIRLLGSAALAIGLVFGASTASATTISFGPTDWVYNSSDEIGWTVDIDDNTAGVWTVAISTNAGMGDTTGSLLGFGFDSTLSGLTLADLTKVSGSTSETFNGLYADSRGCGNGCNFNGAVSASEKFDYVVGIGSAGAGRLACTVCGKLSKWRRRQCKRSKHDAKWATSCASSSGRLDVDCGFGRTWRNETPQIGIKQSDFKNSKKAAF